MEIIGTFPRNATLAAASVNGAAPIMTIALHPVFGFIEKTLVIAEFDVRKLHHDFTELITRAINRRFGCYSLAKSLPDSSPPHWIRPLSGFHCSWHPCSERLIRGDLLWNCRHFGMSLGIVQKFLASPTPRAALVLGKALSAGVRALSQAFVVYVLALVLGVKLNWNPLPLLGMLVTIVLAAVLFSTFSLIVACIVKTRERFMGIGQVLTMPLFFASNAIYPTAIMPNWLQTVSLFNPLTYVVDALRTFMLAGSTSNLGLIHDFMVILLTTLCLILIGAKIYPRIGI